MPRNWLHFLLGLAGAVALAAPGCKAKPAPPSGFLQQTEKMAEPEDLPFHRAWYDKDADWDKFTEIYVAPVNVDYLAEMTWWDQVAFAGDNKEDAKELGAYARQRIVKAFREDPNQKLRVVDKPGPHTIILEMAIVELKPTNAWLNAAGYGGAGVALDKGTVAIEARLVDGGTKQVIAMFADREQGKEALISAKDVTWYGHAYGIVDDWADQAVEIANTPEGGKVSDTSPITLKPW